MGKLTDIELALLGDRAAQERITERGGMKKHYPYKNGSWVRNPKLYSLWNSMIHRCEDKKRESYQRYGKRGIAVCKEWHDANVFMDWAENNGYKPGLQIDRIDNEKGYSPENCRWVTAKQNSRNTRRNRNLTINGEKKTVSEWCEIYDVSPYTVYWWIKHKGEDHAVMMIQKKNTRAPILTPEQIKRLEEANNDA